MGKHTPGPWEIHGGEIHARVNIGRDMSKGILQPIYDVPIKPSLSVGGDGVVYATLSYDSYRQFPSVDFLAMQKANANLIAAAPDLLEAAKLAEAAFPHFDPTDAEAGAVRALVAAIAKAEPQG